MNILSMPYFGGGLSHLLPLYVLNHKYIKSNSEINNYFLVNDRVQNFLKMRGVNYVPMDYFGEDEMRSFQGNLFTLREKLFSKQKQAYAKVKPDLIIEDCSFASPLIAEKNDIPRISFQRTGIFRSINKDYRNNNHLHSLEKEDSIEKSPFANMSDSSVFKHEDSKTHFLKEYLKPKVKLIPGIPTIEKLPGDIENRDSYFYSGPLIVKDKPSQKLSIKLNKFLEENKGRQIVFITTGTVDRTPIQKYIEYFAEKGYAVITTSDNEYDEKYSKQILYNRLFPLHYICGISDLVVHQCGSGMYHYPIINRVPSLTIGTKCYDREDVALRLEQLGVSGHIPHPDDASNYFDVFEAMVEKFENKTLANFDMIDQLRAEIYDVTSNFNIEKVIKYALT